MHQEQNFLQPHCDHFSFKESHMHQEQDVADTSCVCVIFLKPRQSYFSVRQTEKGDWLIMGLVGE